MSGKRTTDGMSDHDILIRLDEKFDQHIKRVEEDRINYAGTTNLLASRVDALEKFKDEIQTRSKLLYTLAAAIGGLIVTIATKLIPPS